MNITEYKDDRTNLIEIIHSMSLEECAELAGKLTRQRLLDPQVKRVTTIPNVGRNDRCPCGSGKKFKKCCLLLKSGE